jgi:hypothetical protein
MANTGNKYIIIYDKGEEKNQTVLCKDEKATATKEKELLEKHGRHENCEVCVYS